MALVVKEPICQCRRHRRGGFDPWFRKIPWRRAWQPTPVFLPGESHGQRSLVGYSPWGCTESDMTKVTKHAPTNKSKAKRGDTVKWVCGIGFWRFLDWTFNSELNSQSSWIPCWTSLLEQIGSISSLIHQSECFSSIFISLVKGTVIQNAFSHQNQGSIWIPNCTAHPSRASPLLPPMSKPWSFFTWPTKIHSKDLLSIPASFLVPPS